MSLLATKLFPPARRARQVARPRLVDRLDPTLSPGHRLTVVSAPAGFGKTTLLSDWVTQFPERSRVAWLSLDDGDNAVPRFLAHVWGALANAGFDLDPKALDSLVAEPASAAMIAVVNEAVRAKHEHPGGNWVLVLEDYHVITAPEVHEAVSFLLDHAPDQLHLLVAARSDPPLPLSRLRSRGQLTEVRAADLRFTPEEALEYFNDVMGLGLSDRDVEALEDRTEGWIAGLQLAALSLSGVSEHRDVVEFIGAFSGSHRFVIDYLMDEVLARQSAGVRDFLLATAILDRLSGALCDAVTGGSDGADVLADLDRRNVFVVPLDADRSWYRYHHLFGDVLRARLLAERAEQVPQLHLAACSWYEEEGLPEDAIRHALAASDLARAASLIESALPDVRRARLDSLLLSWMEALPEQLKTRSPVLSIVSAWSRMMAGDLDGMQRWLDDAEAALAAGADDPALAAKWADTEDLRTAPATIWMYRAALAQARGDVPATVRHARRSLELAGPEDHVVRGGAGGFLGLAAWAAGDVQEALVTFTEAVRSLHAAGNLVDELDTTVVIGDMWLTAGRPHHARRVYERALATATAHGPPYPRAAADLHVGLAELDLEQRDVASAQAHLESARVLRERSSITENRHRWYAAMAQVVAISGDYPAALVLLDQAVSLYRPGFYPDIRPIHALRARMDISAAELDDAEQWARSHKLTAGDAASFLHEYEHLTLVRLGLARHGLDRRLGRSPAGPRDSEPLDDLLGLLDRLGAGAERPGSLLEIGMLRALVLDARRDRPAALAELDRALTNAPEPDGYVSLFLDEGEPMLALLRDAASLPAGGELDILRHHARRLLALAGHAGGAARVPSARGALADPLSERELDVLRMLDTDLTGPEIAGQLFVSVNTLRTHTKRIFTKLEVTNRSAAVRRGRELKLL